MNLQPKTEQNKTFPKESPQKMTPGQKENPIAHNSGFTQVMRNTRTNFTSKFSKFFFSKKEQGGIVRLRQSLTDLSGIEYGKMKQRIEGVESGKGYFNARFDGEKIFFDMHITPVGILGRYVVVPESVMNLRVR
jgi:hypothetical protein